ncbi:MAG: flagellar basal body L-ring protein FlgH [Pseudomonadota bacterium]
MRKSVIFVSLIAAGCARLDHVGKPPSFTPLNQSREAAAMLDLPEPAVAGPYRTVDSSSLWTGTRGSLFADRRAAGAGDILTVVIQIDEEAEISNRSSRSRSGSEALSIDNFLGLPAVIDPLLAGNDSLQNAANASSNSSSSGDGSVRRNEKLTLRLAATVVEELPNGVVRIEGSQEVRVNFEIRELLVSGYVRPEDISRRNEITYDKIASARISYGGRGQISDVQQPRYGQQIADIVLPF